MTEPITFTLRELLAFGTFLLALIIAVAKIGWSVWRIKRNDFGEFIKKEKFEGLEKTVNRIDKVVAVLDERSEKQGEEIKTLFKWKNSK